MRLALAAVLATSCGGPKTQPPEPAASTAAAPEPATPRPSDAASDVPDAAIDAPAAVVVVPPPTCSGTPNPKGCPATEPNINRPCSTKGVECSYSARCCGVPLYVCTKNHFEARFIGCPR